MIILVFILFIILFYEIAVVYDKVVELEKLITDLEKRYEKLWKIFYFST